MFCESFDPNALGQNFSFDFETPSTETLLTKLNI
jgi:hypothetical protein